MIPLVIGCFLAGIGFGQDKLSLQDAINVALQNNGQLQTLTAGGQNRSTTIGDRPDDIQRFQCRWQGNNFSIKAVIQLVHPGATDLQFDTRRYGCQLDAF